MTIEIRPEQGRSVMTAREAARYLRKDPRTVRRMIESGQLAGFTDNTGERRRWYVYTDQLGPDGPLVVEHKTAGRQRTAGATDLHVENVRLRQENSDLRAQLASTEDAYRTVLAQQATMQEALAEYQQSVDQLLAGTSSYRDAAQQFQGAATSLQASNTKLTAVLGTYQGALHQHLIPGHAGELFAHPEQP
ncbi:helix-turn-helix domain-containing protein [Mycolicibacterium sp. Y3]